MKRKIYKINNLNCYDIYKDIYLREKECEENPLQGIQLTVSLKAEARAKMADGREIKLRAEENSVKKTLGKRSAIPLHYDVFKNLYILAGSKRIQKFALSSSEKVTFSSKASAATFKLFGISLKYDAIFEELYAIFELILE